MPKIPRPLFSLQCICLCMMPLLLFLFFKHAEAAQLNLAWQPCSSGGIAGYKIYYGTSSGTYNASLDAGDATSCAIDRLEEGKTVFITATAYDANGKESIFSEEISKYIPLSDSDADGLPDIDETDKYRSDPHKADTDGDGITDADELAYFGDDWNVDLDGDGIINLLDPDSDGDGFADGAEIDRGTNPSDPNDKPGTPDNALETMVEAYFDADRQGFVFAGDLFRGTRQPVYARGEWTASGGHDGGALKLVLGGVDNKVVKGMSGGWQHTFTLARETDVWLSFRYNLTQTAEYERDEISQVLLSVDGRTIGLDGQDFIAQIAGAGAYKNHPLPPSTTGWQFVEINIGVLPAGSHSFVIGAYNNKKTTNDEISTLIVDDVVASGFSRSTGIEAYFDGDPQGFAFAEDLFRGTGQSAYASGEWTPSGGHDGGALKVVLGGRDNAVIERMSGGWQRTFTLSRETDVWLSFRYNLTQAAEYERDEISQVLLSFDNRLIGLNGQDYIAQIAGAGAYEGHPMPPSTTGWQIFETHLGILPAGEHDFIIGAYNNKKTSTEETTTLAIDDVIVGELR